MEQLDLDIFAGELYTFSDIKIIMLVLRELLDAAVSVPQEELPLSVRERTPVRRILLRELSLRAEVIDDQ